MPPPVPAQSWPSRPPRWRLAPRRLVVAAAPEPPSYGSDKKRCLAPFPRLGVPSYAPHRLSPCRPPDRVHTPRHHRLVRTAGCFLSRSVDLLQPSPPQPHPGFPLGAGSTHSSSSRGSR